MKSSKHRILGALAAITLATASYAGGPRHSTAPVVQLPPNGEVTPIPKKMAGPSVTMPSPHDDYVAPVATQAATPKADVQARVESTRLHSTHHRGGEGGPVVQLPQK